MKRWLYISTYLIIFLTDSFSQNSPEIYVTTAHGSYITTATTTPDNKYIVTGSQDQTVKIWDLSSLKEVRTLAKHSQSIQSIALNNEILLSASDDRSVIVWDISTGKEKSRFTEHTAEVKAVALIPEKNLAVSGDSQGNIIFWDITSGKIIAKFEEIHPDNITAIAYLPTQNRLISASKSSFETKNNTLIVWDISTFKPMKILREKADQHGIDISPDGKFFLSYTSNHIKIWNAYTLKMVQTLKIEKTTTAIFHPSQYAVITLNHSLFTSPKINIWDLTNGKLITTKTTTDGVSTLCRISDQEIALLTKMPELWSVSSLRPIKQPSKQPLIPDNVFITQNNQSIFLLSNNSLAEFDIKQGTFRKSVKVPVTERSSLIPTLVAFFRNQSLLAISQPTREVTLFNIATQKEISSLKGHNHIIRTLFPSTDNKYILVGDENGDIALWNIESNEREKNINLFKAPFYDAVLTYNKKYIIASDKFNELISVNLVTMSQHKFPKEWRGNNKIWAFPSSQRIIVGTDNGALMNVETTTLEQNFEWWKWHNSQGFWKHSINCLAISPDEKSILSGGDDKTIFLWNLETAKPIRKFEGHNGNILSLQFLDNGNRFISAASDGSIKLWDKNQNTELATFYYFPDGEWIVITPEGYFNASTNGAKYINVRFGNNVYTIDNFFEIFYDPKFVKQKLEGKALISSQTLANIQPLPPIVKIISPKNGETLTEENTQLTVELEDLGGGIDEIVIYHNDKLTSTTQRGFKPVKKSGEKITQTFSVLLTGGENRLKIIAFDKNRIESIPAEITIYYKEAFKKPTLYLLAIGIDKYLNERYNLNYAVADAEGFTKAIQKGATKIFHKLQIITLYNEQATRERIMAEIEKIKNQARPEDVFILYYAGHGVMSEEENPKFYLAPNEITQLYGNNTLLVKNGISQDDLRTISLQIKAQKQLYVLDACQSGGMLDALAARGVTEERAIAQLSRSTGTYWLAASGSQQFAGEIAHIGHGIFTYAILEAATGKADNGDKKITVQEISTYINDRVPELSKQYRKTAQWPTTFGFGQDFPLFLID